MLGVQIVFFFLVEMSAVTSRGENLTPPYSRPNFNNWVIESIFCVIFKMRLLDIFATLMLLLLMLGVNVE